jgi:hypothetical protein
MALTTARPRIARGEPNCLTADLHRLYNNNGENPGVRLNDKEVKKWSASLGVSRAELYNLIAMYLAEGFNNSELSFDFCDSIVNDIHRVITFANEARPDLFWKVFLAFDEGEYYHDNDFTQDPVDVYTRPLIARIVSGGE